MAFNSMVKRVLFWVIFVGAIGGLLESKAAIIEFNDVFTGVVIGGGIGFFIAMIANAFSRHK